MRRFFIWSALSALIGLMLAAGCFWAYWSFYARFQPVVIGRNDTEIQQLLDEASWISDGAGSRPVYVISYRDSASARRFKDEQVPILQAAGVEARFILFARADRDGAAQSTTAERATVAELWLTRDWALYQRWTVTPARSWTAAGLPQADGNLARMAVVDAGRRFNERMTALLKEAGVPISYPLILWRDGRGVLKACGCADSRSWAFVRDDLNAPEVQLGAQEERARTTASAWAVQEDEDEAPRDTAMPYPDLPPASAQSRIAPPEQHEPPVPQEARPVSPSPQRSASPPMSSSQAAPSRPRPAPPRSSRPAPVPSTQDDATFY